MAGDEPPGEQTVTAADDVPTLAVLPLHSTDLLTLVDGSGVIQYESPSIERLYGFDQDELVGEQVSKYFHPEDRERVVTAFESVVAGDEGLVEAVEYRHRMADDSYRWIESVASSNPTPGGNYVVNSRDISERKRRERELETAREQARSERDGKEAIRQLLLRTATDDEIAESTCRLLVGSYGYEAAWVVWNHDADAQGEPNPLWAAESGSDRGFRPGTGNAQLHIDSATSRALVSGDSVCVTTNAPDDQALTDRLADCGLYSVRAEPLAYDGIISGVLTVVRDTPGRQFHDELVSEVAGALAFKQRLNRQQEALVAETATEITVSIGSDHTLAALSVAPSLPDGVELAAEELCRTDELGTYLVKGQGVSGPALAQAARDLAATQDATVVTETDATAVVEIRTAADTLGTLLGKYGGVLASMSACAGQVTLRVQFPGRTNLSAVAETIDRHWPGATIRSRKQGAVEQREPAAFGSLTQKQEDALRAATLAGFFQRPQQATAADVAETLGVSQSTFLHHLRNAEHEIFQQRFAEESG